MEMESSTYRPLVRYPRLRPGVCDESSYIRPIFDTYPESSDPFLDASSGRSGSPSPPARNTERRTETSIKRSNFVVSEHIADTTGNVLYQDLGSIERIQHTDYTQPTRQYAYPRMFQSQITAYYMRNLPRLMSRDTTSSSPTSHTQSRPTRPLAEVDDSRDIQSQPSPNRTIEQVFTKVSDVIREPLWFKERTSLGHAYLLSDTTQRSKIYKIGSSADVPKRANEIRYSCKRENWDAIAFPRLRTRGYVHLEKIAQSELGNWNYRIDCVCSTHHTEYFQGQMEFAHGVLGSWSEWLVRYAPYDDGGHLSPFWTDRLKCFEAGMAEYFNCRATGCAERDSGTVACRGCLRKGWETWAQPTSFDWFEYDSRMKISSEWTRKVLLLLWWFVPVHESIFYHMISVAASVTSLWTYVRKSTTLIDLMYGRLAILMIQRIVQTASPEYIILDAAFFTAIYFIIRTRLSHASLNVTTQAERAHVLHTPNRKPHLKKCASTPAYLGSRRFAENPTYVAKETPMRKRLKSPGMRFYGSKSRNTLKSSIEKRRTRLDPMSYSASGYGPMSLDYERKAEAQRRRSSH